MPWAERNPAALSVLTARKPGVRRAKAGGSRGSEMSGLAWVLRLKVHFNYVFSLFSEDLEVIIYLQRERGGGNLKDAFSGTKAWPY